MSNPSEQNLPYPFPLLYDNSQNQSFVPRSNSSQPIVAFISPETVPISNPRQHNLPGYLLLPYDNSQDQYSVPRSNSSQPIVVFVSPETIPKPTRDKHKVSSQPKAVTWHRSAQTKKSKLPTKCLLKYIGILVGIGILAGIASYIYKKFHLGKIIGLLG